MPAKGYRTEKVISGDPSDPLGMNVLVRRYFEALQLRDYASGSIKKFRLHLNDFIDWCSERDLTQPKEITRKILQNYQRHMLHQIDKRGNPFSFRNQHSRIGSIRVWFKWLMKNEHISHNPSTDLDLPKIARRLPKNILTQQESEAILSQPDINQPHGLRDRAMLETFYSTGMRRMELIRLQVSDLDHERGVVAIYEGKGKKDRIIPIGDRALGWIQRYLTEVRPNFVVDFGNSSLFLTSYGNEFSGSSMSILVHKYIDNAAIGKTGSCHLFRHTMATLMLENGADTRFIQEMLGHTNLETTQIYTRVSIRKLQEVHTETHPARNTRIEPTE